MDYTLEELLPIVQALTEKYTLNDSTSITFELANQLMVAVLYCINEFFSDIDNVSLRVSKPEAKKAYEAGHRLVYEKTVSAKEQYEKVLQEFEAYGNQMYYDTIVKGMPSFFLYYDIDFAPQNHILTLDYPVLSPDLSLCGIDAIWEYLSCVRQEQRFLHRFPPEHVRAVLSAHHHDYENLIINVCGQVLQHSLICIMIQRPLSTVKFSSTDFGRIVQIVSGKTPQQLETQLLQLLKEFVQKIYGNDTRLLSYLQRELCDFSVRLVSFANQYPNCTDFYF